MSKVVALKFKEYKNLIGVALLTLVNILGFSILIPVLPFIVDQYGATKITYGFLLSIYSICQFVAAPVFGALSDLYGRKTVLLLSQLGTFLAWILFGVAWFLPNIKIFDTTLPIVVISLSRILDGITGGNSAVANAYLSDITPANKKVKYFGAITAIFGIGFLIGPILGSYSSLTSIGYLGTVLLASLISLVTLLFIRFFIDESLDPALRNHDLKLNLRSELNLFNRIRKYKQNTSVINLLWVWFFYSMAYGAYITVIILYIKDIFHLNEQGIGNMMLPVGITLIINQLVIAKFLSKKLGEIKFLLMGLIFSAIGFIAMTLTTDLWLFLLFSFIFGLGFSFTLPTLKALLANLVSKNQQGEVMGLDESINSFSLSITPLISAIFYTYIGVWTFLILAILVVIALTIYLKKYRQIQKQLET